METRSDRQAAKEFFNEAILKWQDFIAIWNRAMKNIATSKDYEEANSILAWFQTNYPIYKEYSTFEMYLTRADDGKSVEIDPIFDVIFQGSTIGNILRHSRLYVNELNQVMPQLRGHASQIKEERELRRKKLESPIAEIIRIVDRFHFAALQLKNRRKGKTPFQIDDEYDVQDLLQTFLKLEFDDVRKEEPTPSYAGAASRIDIVLKNEKISVETKKTRENLGGKEIGSQLINDIARYKNYPEIDAVVFFIYDPDFIIENPDGLKSDLEKLSTAKLKVIVVISPKGKD